MFLKLKTFWNLLPILIFRIQIQIFFSFPFNINFNHFGFVQKINFVCKFSTLNEKFLFSPNLNSSNSSPINFVLATQDISNIQNPASFNNECKFYFFETLIKYFPKEPRNFICQYLKSPECSIHMKSCGSLEFIKREKLKILSTFFINFIQNFARY
jgi:hypothetical protein